MSAATDAMLEQLGGARIFAMAFASAMESLAGRRLVLRIAPGARAAGRATHVLVTLEAGDAYTVEVHRIPRSARVSAEVVGYREGVHAAELKATVEELTGLRLSL